MFILSFLGILAVFECTSVQLAKKCRILCKVIKTFFPLYTNGMTGFFYCFFFNFDPEKFSGA